jgi:energy-converting hydrogenase Eha subunit B
MTPFEGRQNTVINAIIYGNGFLPGASVTFSGDGITTRVTSVTNGVIRAEVTIAPDATPGTGFYSRRNVIITNPGGETATLLRYFGVLRN